MKRSIRRYRHWYAKLIRLYPKPYYQRFGEGMEQTFTDLLRERAEEERRLFGPALRMFLETSAGIFRENATFVVMQTNVIRLAIGTGLILLIPLALTLLGDGKDGKGWNWKPGDFVFAFVLMFGTGLAYELLARKAGNILYRFAVGIALAAAFMLVWVNAAVGIIGTEDDDANLMYGGVLAVGVIGALIARFQPDGMARAMFATALAQALVGVIALIAGWGSDGPIWPRDVLGATGFFVALWLMSAWLFRYSARETSLPQPR